MRIRLGLVCLLLTATTASAQSLEQQAMCAKQAKIAFDNYAADYSNTGLPKPVSTDYQSHYNTKLNKCLIDVQSTRPMGEEFLTSVVLVDAFERRVYAVYTRTIARGEGILPPTKCDLIPTPQTQTHCTSKDEFDAFVAKYMEE
jgi:hypothetical protein